jgi:hypothetical protein
MREIRSKPDMPVWREDEEGRGTSLVITRAGQDAIGIEDGGNDGSGEPAAPKNEAPAENQQPSRRESSTIVDEPRSGSKQARIIKMLSRKSGATLQALVDVTGWLPHTTRAALTGLRKRGYEVVLERQDGKSSIYRITSANDRAAA